MRNANKMPISSPAWTIVGLWCCIAIGCTHTFAADNTLSLSGTWEFIRGAPDLAKFPGKLGDLKFSDNIKLPGTTETNRKGPESTYRSEEGLTFPWSFAGVCYYAREVTVPHEWEKQRITLFLERTKYTQVWLDGLPVGENGICCTPQEYDLGAAVVSGKHRLVIAVDNRRIPPTGADAHQFSGSTQGNWNGIIGRIELTARPAVWIEDLQAYPDATKHQLRIVAKLKSSKPSQAGGTLTFAVHGPEVSVAGNSSGDIHWANGEATSEVNLDLGVSAHLWDEFHPDLYVVKADLSVDGVADEQTVRFGLRSFAAEGRQLKVNGHAVFLRGKHDACVYPLTGFPPMDVDGWRKYFGTLRDYGLNHVRFHTWTPPEAAFEAADELGFYLQPELPFWGPFDQKVKDALKPEALAILRRLGNHPSFVMFSMGNEHWADPDVLDSLVAELKASDSRHLYVRGTNAFSYRGRPGKNDDYYIGADLASADGKPIKHIRGSNSGSGEGLGHVQTGLANTTTDYAAAMDGVNFPVIAHEMGQYTVFPNFAEISKYVGVTRAYNFEHFKSNLARAGMAKEDEDFAAASGALAEICYREEIESCLRTPDFGGFELLDLQDYPGQGTALVGMLDAFMDSKHIVAPKRWRECCGPTVILARFAKYVWTTNERLSARLEFSNYSDRVIPAGTLAWELTDASGKVVRNGTVASNSLKTGALSEIGSLSIPLEGVAAPAAYSLVLKLKDTEIQTSYPIWVYPQPSTNVASNNGLTVRTLDTSARAALAAGKSVLLVCSDDSSLARTVGGGFASDFWGFNFFHNRPGTLGIFCDPKSPALADFPTESHSDWHWFDIALHSQPLILDSILPPNTRATVQVIDNSTRCHKLGLIFELKVGEGKLLVCASDLIRLSPDHPEARQLLVSLQDYVRSTQFNPTVTASPEQLADLFQTCVNLQAAGAVATASSSDNGWQGFKPAQLIDGNESKGWRAESGQSGPVWCQIDFKKPTDLSRVELLWNREGPGFEYSVQQSSDGKEWKTIKAHCGVGLNNSRQQVQVNGQAITHLRVLIEKTPDNRPAEILEIHLFPNNVN